MPASDRAIRLIAFVVGASSLGAEIAAARLLAPFFGDSTVIWANTIATVLVALSAGYAVGGRWADRDPTLRGLCRIVLAAAVLLAAVPFVAGPFLRVSVDALDSVEAGAFVGSLIGVLVLVATPVFLLGMVSPFAVRLSVAAVDEAGRVAGRLSAISTLGSLTGTFASALVLVPFLGTRRTFLVYALALAVVAVLGLRDRRVLLAPAAVLALIALPVGTVKDEVGDGARVVWERETEYQYARVVEASDGERTLELNEGQAIHSIYRPGRWLTGNYWDEPLVLPFATRAQPPRSIAILGGAAGTVARSYGRFFPRTRVDLVEIDGELLEAGRELFDLRGPDLHLHSDDARPWLRRTDRDFDVLFVDAYRQPYIPFYLTTTEFFELCQDRLAPGGMVVINVGHPEESDELERVLTRTMGSVFRTVLRDPSRPTNTQLVATDAPASAAGIERAAASLPPDLAATARATAARLAPGLDGGTVYTDDKAPVEWLVDSSIVDVAAEGER
ncbi:spermidine synthase [Conexibacter sp. SYSU D00693]|uniref:spermidine synthase n=1 Tax=Conexibacter sp. SYSU D00693 TaxID=2812560 RepID=UPI00196B842E|nr:fused MFS/spermidine synthase [Conexibacter sp. SYSU D00693]